MANLQAGVLLRHIRKLATGDSTVQVPDRQLLGQFAAQHDESAFSALIQRHGPMVLGVCRRVLNNAHDAEDAFQATFLILARKAAAIRQQESVSGWLYQVAYHTALKARVRSSRRAARERETTALPPADPLAEASWREVHALLDEELQRLPDRYRAPLVLCYLEGQTQEQAAAQLGWTKSTLRRRLEEGRQRLRQRLARRGLAPAAALATLLLTDPVPAALPPALAAATVRTALLPAAATPPPLAVLTEGVLATMNTTRLPIALLVLLTLGALAVTVGTLLQPAAAQRPNPSAGRQGPTPAASRTSGNKGAAAALPKPTGGKASKTIAISGRVLDPQGKPVPAADVAVVIWSHQLPQVGQVLPRPAVWGRTRADRDGRFRLDVERRGPVQYYRQRFYQLAVLAAARGHGVGWRCLQFDVPRAEAEVRLHREQVVRGRLLDVQGQPIAGAQVEVVRLGKKAPAYHFFAGADDDESIHTYAGVFPFEKTGGTIRVWDKEILLFEAPERLPCWPEPATTDAQGRFTLRGLIRNQPAALHVRPRERGAFQKIEIPAVDQERPAEKSFSLAAAHLIEGTVTDEQTGRPLAGARVHIDASDGGIFAPPGTELADWKGRGGLLGGGHGPLSLPTQRFPAVEARTDARGRYRLNPYRGREFSVIVSAPPGQPYLRSKRTIAWPRGAGRQECSVALRRGVLLRGQVIESSSGQPIAGARVDFWSKDARLPKDIFSRLPVGVLPPRPVKTDARGEFRLTAPAGAGHLLINGPGSDFDFKKIEAGQLGLEIKGGPLVGRSGGKRMGKKHFYYPDEWLALNLKVGAEAAPLALKLRRAPRVRGRLVGPDGKPVAQARFFPGQEPFAEPSHGQFAPPSAVKDGQFDLPVLNPEAPLCVAFVDVKRGLGAVATFTARDAGGKPVTVRLNRCGSATVRFLDVQGKPLVGYRPLLWLSLPSPGYSTGKELEDQLCFINVIRIHLNYDAVWMGWVDEQRYRQGPKTDDKGRVTLPALIPGAAYRISLFDGTTRDFTVETGKTLKLPDLTIKAPEKTRLLSPIK
jgi:RNA polymerase sigma factor (sigma-70 family)